MQSVSAYQTTPDLLEALSQRETLHFAAKPGRAALPVIAVDDAQRSQSIDGFGAPHPYSRTPMPSAFILR